MSVHIHQLSPGEVHLLEALSKTFAEAFDDSDTYASYPPSSAYLRRLLGGDSLIAVVAMKDDVVVGGLVAYELKKFEQERSEIYLYDLAVATGHRREGIAESLIEHLRKIAAERDAFVIFVQADTGVEDKPAISLYTKLGTREEVLHFDIAVNGGSNLCR